MTVNKNAKTDDIDTSGILIRLNAEKSLQLAEALLNPARGPNPRLIAAAKRYLTSCEAEPLVAKGEA